ncbi:DUF4157 domain-containing protein [Candidatus Aerophobetes bacterium]|uniref:DUF4157 domain-containing protein n=1 Tax=Aerophobetes bacterium TaxID=2030807 RepID=A0A523UWC3_UNCAE|nr:MAG: DUF4157 domain-containing protein [Candidatus Aerophobetes bacterium]
MVLQRQCITPECEEEEEVLQMKQTSGTIESDQDVIGQILQHKGSGRPLEPDVREFMESRFGYDFGDVKIHTDSHAAETSEKLGAEAFTVGRDVYFGRGRYRPISLKGKKLIAHELVHVLQQRGKGMMLQSTPAMTQPGDPYETEADRIALPVVEMPGLSPYYPIEVHSLHSASPAFISRAVPVALIVLGAFVAAAACALAFFIAGMRKTGKSDKWKHCWVSCKIGTWCPPIPVISQVISALVGAAKEVADIVIGAAQMRDFIANLEGIECSARYFTSCESCCNAKGL